MTRLVRPLLLVLVTAAALWGAARGAAPGADLEAVEVAADAGTRSLVCPPGGPARVAEVSESGARPVRTVTGDPAVAESDTDSGGTAGLAGAVLGRGDREGAAGGCESPRASWWFQGAGAGPAHRSTLRLVNPRSGVAVVDVAVYGEDGTVDAPELRGVAVPAGRSVEVRLDRVAPAAGDVAVRVQAQRGLVVPSLADELAPAPGATRVAEWIPAQTAPRRTSVVTGLPRRPGEARLLLTNPGSSAAVATVELATSRGRFRPDGLAPQRVPAEATVSVPLPRAVGREQTSVVVTSRRPLVAGALAASATDVVHTAAGEPGHGPAGAVVAGADEARLVLTATGEQETRVPVRFLDARGRELDAQEVRVAALATTAVDVPGRAAVVVVSDSPRVTAAVLVTAGRGVSALPLRPAAPRILVPTVRPAG